MDGDTSATSTTLADADRVVVNDAGTMKQVALTDFETYFESALDTLSNVTTVGALNSGSITSGFGSINNGSSAITTTGTITFGTLSDGTDSVTDIVTSVGTGSTNSELATAAAVESRIQAVNGTANNVTGLTATGAELNAVADVSAITIDTSTAIANNDGIAVFDSSASSIGYFDVDLLDTYFAGTTKTLTNKTLTSPTVSGLQLSDSGFSVEGSSADANETTVSFTNPTADRTITFPDATGNVAVFTTAPTAAITDGTSGQVLTTNGSGVLSFADAGGNLELYAENPSSPTTPIATGANDVAIGTQAEATGGAAIALGYDAVASGNLSLAINAATASNTASIAIGQQAVASGSSSLALGYGTDATGGFSTAVGRNAQATSTSSNAFGRDAVSAGNQSTAIGDAYASGADSFAAVITNNTSSYGATGANSIAIGENSKAFGTYRPLAVGFQASASQSYSTAIGPYTSATASNATALGSSAAASGDYSIAIGDATADAYFSVAIGKDANTNGIRGKYAFACGDFSATGDAQTGTYVLRSDTTDATAEALTTNKSTASTDNQIILQNESAMTFTGTIVVREDATDGDDYAGWEIKGVIMRGTGVATTTLGVGIVNSLYHTSGLANAAVALSADTTNGGLKIQVTGIASTNLRWVATVHTREVVNA